MSRDLNDSAEMLETPLNLPTHGICSGTLVGYLHVASEQAWDIA